MLIIGRMASNVKPDYTMKQIFLCGTRSVKYELGCSRVMVSAIVTVCGVIANKEKELYQRNGDLFFVAMADVANQLTQLDRFLTRDQANSAHAFFEPVSLCRGTLLESNRNRLLFRELFLFDSTTTMVNR